MPQAPRIPLRSIRDVAATARGRRLDLGLSQAALATRAGVSRKWINEFEAGNAGAELALVLRVLDELGLDLVATAGRDDSASQTPNPVDLDTLIELFRGRGDHGR